MLATDYCKHIVDPWTKESTISSDQLRADLPPNLIIYEAENAFLHHDSYVELQQLVRHIAYEINRAEHLGRMHIHQAKRLVQAVMEADTLTEDQKDLIADKLLADD
jgi:hypothetical protein